MTLKPRKQHYRRTPGRCQACGSRLVTGDWHKPGSGGSIQCAHCRPVVMPDDEIPEMSPQMSEMFRQMVEARIAGPAASTNNELLQRLKARQQRLRPASKFCESGGYDGCTCDWCR